MVKSPVFNVHIHTTDTDTIRTAIDTLQTEHDIIFDQDPLSSPNTATCDGYEFEVSFLTEEHYNEYIGNNGDTGFIIAYRSGINDDFSVPEILPKLSLLHDLYATLDEDLDVQLDYYTSIAIT